MKIIQPSLFPQLNEVKLFGFLIVITPSPEIVAYVNALKSEFYQTYGKYRSMDSKPHISICQFLMFDERQSNVLRSLQKSLSGISPFELKLNGFGHFRGSNVIYLRVEQSEELESLKKLFVYSLQRLWIEKNKIVVKNHHLTVAKDIHPGIFNSACDNYLPRPYHNSFMVDKLTVLRYAPYEARYSKLMDLKLGE